MKRLSLLLAYAYIFAGSPVAVGATLRVGTGGGHATIQAAVDAVLENGAEWTTIEIAPGTYDEKVIVPKEKPFVRLVAAEEGRVVVTSAESATSIKEKGLKECAALTVRADDFEAVGIVFENTASRENVAEGGRGVGVAHAVKTEGDRIIFRRCRMLGHHGTLRVHSYDGTLDRCYFEDCVIEGNVDYILGSARCLFYRCTMRNVAGGYIAAPGTDADNPFGFVFKECVVTAVDGAAMFLARPWRPYAHAAFVDCVMADGVKFTGWNDWGKDENRNTARFGEYGSIGPESAANHMDRREKWANYDKLSWRDYLRSNGCETEFDILSGGDGWHVTIEDEDMRRRRMKGIVLASYDNETLSDYARYVAVDGIVLDINRRASSTQIRLADGARTALVIVNESIDAPLPAHLAAGARIRARGVWTYLLREDASARRKTSHAYTLYAQHFDELEVLTFPPWWTPVRVWTAIAFALLLLVAALGWGFVATAKMRRERHAAAAIAAERKRMASDIHDSVEQHLSAARMLLNSMLPLEGDVPPELATVKTASEILEAARREIRQTVWNLRIEELCERPPEEVLRGLARRIAEQRAVSVRTCFRGLPPRLKPYVLQDIVFVVTEAVANAIKHGKAKRVLLVADPLRQLGVGSWELGVGRGFVLRIVNDGEIFNPENAPGPAAGHFGLSGMRERARRSGFGLKVYVKDGLTIVELEVKA